MAVVLSRPGHGRHTRQRHRVGTWGVQIVGMIFQEWKQATALQKTTTMVARGVSCCHKRFEVQIPFVVSEPKPAVTSSGAVKIMPPGHRM